VEQYTSLTLDEMVALVRYHLKEADNQLDDWMDVGSEDLKTSFYSIHTKFGIITRIIEAAEEELSEIASSQ